MIYTTGNDYNSGNFIVEFIAEITRATFIVVINEDNIFEDHESFNLSISSSSLPSKVTITNPGQATVTIVDNDGM